MSGDTLEHDSRPATLSLEQAVGQKMLLHFGGYEPLQGIYGITRRNI